MARGSEHDAASFDELAGGAIKAVEIDGTAILIARTGDGVHAVGATCPHAGGPLAEGVRHGDRVVCPWHKAVFCLRTGVLLEPPAVDALSRYPARVADGRVLVRTDAVEPASVSRGVDARTFVIIGGGGAGAVAAQTLREEGFAGDILMLDRENRVPYDRTLLSKYDLSGRKGGEKSPLQSQAFYRERAIERRTATVTRLHPAARRIECADGTSFRYDKALIATGAMPIPATMPGHSLRNVFTLRNRTDGDAILAQAERSGRAVILGASFIGMEVAAALRERGLDVTVIGKETAPFAKQLGTEIGTAFVDLHRRHGVSFRLGQSAERLEGEGSVERVRLMSGETLDTDLVVTGFGVKPDTDFLDEVRRCDNGAIPVNAAMRVVDDLYAAGDVASFPYRGSLIRVEHWRVAQQHGRIAARAMLGQDAHYATPPVFWTIQYMKRLDYIGHAADWDDIVIHGDIGKPDFLAYYVKDGHVAAAAGMDRDADTAALVELLAMRTWTADELGVDPRRLLAPSG